jgi:hypothetical protein
MASSLDGEELVAEGVHFLDPARRHIAGEAADPAVTGGEARAGELLEEAVEFLALGEGIHEHRPRADIYAEGAEAEEVRGDAGHLRRHDADGVDAVGHLQAGELLDGVGEGVVVRERGDVVQPVRVGDELVVGHVLGDLLVAAVQVADDGVGLGHGLAVELELDAEDAVGGRVRGPHREGHFLGVELLGEVRRGLGGGVGEGLLGGHQGEKLKD